MNKVCERPLLSKPDRCADILLTALILCWLVAGFWLGEAVAAQEENPLLGQTSGFSKGWDYRLVAEVLTQLRNNSREKGDLELYALLQRVRIVVPNRSLKEAFPNAYALADEQAHWVVIEERWMKQVGGFAELGALYSLPAFGANYASFAYDTFYKFCQQYQDIYRKAARNNLQTTVVYMFSFEDFFSRSDPKWAVDYVMFDKLAGLVWLNTIMWTVLHEVGHHALKHTTTVAGSYHTRRQQELDADAWAFSRMKALGYSLFGVGSYMVARAMTEVCLGELGLIGDEKDSTHPRWFNRDTALRRKFNVVAAPAQDTRIFYIPMGIPEPVLTTVVIPDSSTDEFDAIITQPDNVTMGITEWDGKTVRVYTRETTGGRIEFIVEDAMQKTQLIEQRQYDRNNRLVRTIKLPAVQADLVALDFLKINGMKFSDVRKRSKGQKLMAIHLRRVGASESVIPQALAAADQYKKERRYFGLQYVKGRIGYSTLSEQIKKKASMYEQRLIGILGENRYRAFTDSYSNELRRTSPPMTGVDAWEEKLLEENIGR